MRGDGFSGVFVMTGWRSAARRKARNNAMQLRKRAKSFARELLCRNKKSNFGLFGR